MHWSFNDIDNIKYLLWHLNKYYHLCSRTSEHISSTIEKPQCSWHKSLRLQLPKCAIQRQTASAQRPGGAPGIPFTLKKSVLIQWDSIDRVLIEGLMHLSCMGTMKSLALPLYYPLLRASAQLSGDPNLKDILYRKWCFPGSSCLKKVWLVTKTQRGKWSRQENAGPKQDSEQKALPKEAEMCLWECAVDGVITGVMCFVYFSPDVSPRATAGSSATGHDYREHKQSYFLSS